VSVEDEVRTTSEGWGLVLTLAAWHAGPAMPAVQHVAAAVAAAGFDFVVIDLEHTLCFRIGSP